jgi:hypothetical protein
VGVTGVMVSRGEAKVFSGFFMDDTRGQQLARLILSVVTCSGSARARSSRV